LVFNFFLAPSEVVEAEETTDSPLQKKPNLGIVTADAMTASTNLVQRNDKGGALEFLDHAIAKRV
jgi:hypothetical protein